jgi:hypothetical protein
MPTQSVMVVPGIGVLGSVATLQGTNPWLVQPTSGSVIVIGGNSVVGTYSEDTGHTGADKGLFVLGVRNDTISSLTSADLDYSPKAVDAIGRVLIKPFAGEDATIISYQGSIVSTSVTLAQASAIGKRNYITDFWISNTGSVATLVTIQGGDTSVLGNWIVPAGGGSNSQGINIPLKTTPAQDLAYKVGTATSVLYMNIKGYQSQ